MIPIPLFIVVCIVGIIVIWIIADVCTDLLRKTYPRRENTAPPLHTCEMAEI